ncbi:MAG: fumarate hydratase [Bacillota bacterium]
MREIPVSKVTDAVEQLCIQAANRLPSDVLERLRWAKEAEESEVGREIIGLLIENAELARSAEVPICQDTGVAIVFLEVGQDVHFTGGSLQEAIDEGVRRGYSRGYLRKSVVRDPFDRKNTGDNTPAIVHTCIVPGDRLKIVVCPKGTGSENMSQLRMMVPADGKRGVVDFVVETVSRAGSNPCPPIIVGVGVGGMMETAALLAKKALLRPVGQHHPDPEVEKLESEILEAVNNTGIGPQGLGGRITALAVHVETHPTHIGALPVAVNIQCHAARHAEIQL